MSRRLPGSDTRDPEAIPDEGLLRRWARRKRSVQEEEQAAARPSGPAAPDRAESPAEHGAAPPPLPPLYALDAESDYSGFMHPKVSESLRRAALRKLFTSAKFNVVDGLDDYAGDYRNFEPLGDVVTADLRYRRELEAARERARLEASEPDAAPGIAAQAQSPEAANDPPTDAAAATATAPATATEDEPADGIDNPPGERG